MEREHNEAIVRWAVERGLGEGDVESALTAYAPDVVYHNPACDDCARLPPGLEGIRIVLEGARRAFPGMVCAIDAAESDDDWVALIYSWAPAAGAETPAAAADSTGAMFCRLRDGRIVEQWDLDDRLGQMRRRGVVRCADVAAGSDVEEEVDDVAALDDVGLALAPELSNLPHVSH